jgi:hypothetical protein
MRRALEQRGHSLALLLLFYLNGQRESKFARRGQVCRSRRLLHAAPLHHNTTPPRYIRRSSSPKEACDVHAKFLTSSICFSVKGLTSCR